MPKVAYQGEPGAYSERAVKVMFPDSHTLPCETIRLTFSRVTSGEADLGVVPVENSQAGSVNETYDLLLRSSLIQVVGEVVLRVDHALLGPPGARLEGVRRAFSHWQALAQCEEFLATHHIDPVPVHDTAGGAGWSPSPAAWRTARSPASMPGRTSAWRCWPSTSRPTRTTSQSSV
jgi:prephenate dehydratase